MYRSAYLSRGGGEQEEEEHQDGDQTLREEEPEAFVLGTSVRSRDAPLFPGEEDTISGIWL